MHEAKTILVSGAGTTVSQGFMMGKPLRCPSWAGNKEPPQLHEFYIFLKTSLAHWTQSLRQDGNGSWTIKDKLQSDRNCKFKDLY